MGFSALISASLVRQTITHDDKLTWRPSINIYLSRIVRTKISVITSAIDKRLSFLLVISGLAKKKKKRKLGRQFDTVSIDEYGT